MDCHLTVASERAARGARGPTTDVSSTASSGYCGQAHHGAICRTALGLTRPATSGSFAGKRLASGLDGSVQMIDTSIVRVHQHAWRLRGRGETRLTGPVERWVTTKIHACVDTNGLRGVDRAEAATS